MLLTATAATRQKFLNPLDRFRSYFIETNSLLYSTEMQFCYQNDMAWANFSKATHQNSVSQLLILK